MSKEMSFVDALTELLDNVDKIPGLVENVKAIVDTLQGTTNYSGLIRHIGDIQNTIKDVTDIPGLVRDMTTLKNTSTEVREKLSVLSLLGTGIDNANERINDVNEKINNVNESINNAKDKQDECLSNLLTQMSDIIEQQKNEIIKGFGDVSAIQNDLIAKTAVLKAKEGEIADKQKQLAEMSGEKNRLQKEIEEMQPKLQELEGKAKELTEWVELSAPYQELRNAMQASEPAREFLNQKGFGGQDVGDVFKLAVAIGRDISFAENFRQFMEDWKKDKTVPMSEDEIIVYLALNRCYQNSCGMDKEIFLLPNGKSLSEPFEKMSFDKNTMEDLTEPNNKNLKYAHEIFVPELMALNSDQAYSRSKVRAGN